MSGLHVAVIMDGNGRWAQAHGLPRFEGHLIGVEALRRTVEAAPACGITTLSAYAFSADNWKRPRAEVDGLLALFRSYLSRERGALCDAGVRLTVIGRRDRLGHDLAGEMEAPKSDRVAARGFTSGWRSTIPPVTPSSRRPSPAASTVRSPVSASRHESAAGPASLAAGPDVDLLIRTGGEQRLSDFLLWECAYAELWFTTVMWPDFGAADLARAIEEFRMRDRRFGGVAATR